MSQAQLSQLEPEEVAQETNKLGLVNAAKQLKTSKSSLSRWLNEHGYFSKPQYVKLEVAATPQQT